MAVGGYSISILSGYGLAGCSNVSMLTEVSSLFLNYKDMFTKASKDSTLAQINQLVFFLTYTVFRMALLPYLIVVIYKEVVAVWELRSGLENIAAVYTLLQGIAVYALNLFWYMLILKGLQRLIAK